MHVRSTAAVALLAASLGCAPQTPAPDPHALAAVESLGPGEQCPAGGQKILTGVDANGDGVLQASEVTQVAYVCNGQSAASCTTLEGSIVIHNSFEWANLALAGCTRITGTLEIAAQGARSLGAPSPLAEVGSLLIHDNDALAVLEFPALTAVTRDLTLARNTSLVSLRRAFPALASVGGEVTLEDQDTALADADLPALASVGGNVWMTRIQVPGDLSFPRLASLGGAFTLESSWVPGTFSLPELVRAPALHLYSSTIGRAEFTRLASVNLNVVTLDGDTELVFPALSEPSEMLFTGALHTRLRAPTLHTGFISLFRSGIDAVDLAGLTEGTVALEEVSFLPSLELPSFRIGVLQVQGCLFGLTRVSAPALTTAYGVRVTSNPDLTSLELPALTGLVRRDERQLKTAFWVRDNPNLPQCQVDAIVARITSPPPDEVITSGNDTAATCP